MSKSATFRRKLLLTHADSPRERDNFSIRDFEEMGEVSLQLAMIRKKYDILKQENGHKRKSLERLTNEYEQIGSLTNVHSGDQSQVENAYNQLRSNLESHRKKLEEEIINKKTYKHIYDRVHEERIGLELKSNQLHLQLKSAQHILETEKLKARKNFEAIHSSRNSLKSLRVIVDYDNKQKQDRISYLEKNALSRKEAAERREERIRKIAEIADVAANENTESQEIDIKQSLLLHKIWYSYLKYKLDKKLKGAIEIEDAYQNIRSATGLQNITEIVNNFIGKEENQAQQIKNIEDANKCLDELKNKNEKCKIDLKELMLIEGNNNAVEFLRKIREIEEEIIVEKKKSEIIKEEYKNIDEFYEEISNWGKKVEKNLELGQEEDMLSLFKTLKNYISYELGTIASNKDQFVKDWNQTNETSTELLVKSIYQDTYLTLSAKFKSSTYDPDISNVSCLDEEKRKKHLKKVKIV